MLPTSPLAHCWLGVALAAMLLGCGAPAPLDPLASGPDTIVRGHDARDPAPASQPQTGCLRYGDLAADFLWRRDVQHESFAQVFDRHVIALDDVTLSPEAQAQLGAAMRLALAVYGHSTWTAADAYAYGLQDCGRTTP
jgi:hypothetical protein